MALWMHKICVRMRLRLSVAGLFTSPCSSLGAMKHCWTTAMVSPNLFVPHITVQARGSGPNTMPAGFPFQQACMALPHHGCQGCVPGLEPHLGHFVRADLSHCQAPGSSPCMATSSVPLFQPWATMLWFLVGTHDESIALSDLLVFPEPDQNP